jgi:ribose/xylose/arabinose/galactoside ABC-type transport system permease subunit
MPTTFSQDSGPSASPGASGLPPDGALAPTGYRRRRNVQEAGLVGVIVLIMIFLTLSSEPITVRGETVNNFLRIDNLLPNVATPMSWMAIMAIGVTFVIISGGIDISVGSIFGLSALGAAAVLQNFGDDESPWLVIPLGIVVPVGIGLLCGLVNGALVVSLRIHPFIVTLGTMSIFRGIALVSVATKSLPSVGHDLPAAFTRDFISYEMVSGPLGWARLQPIPMLIMLVCVAAAWIYLSHTAGGRKVYAVGGNAEAARFSGISVGWANLRVFALSGLAAGIAGMVSCGYYASANTATGEGYELTVIAAAVVGGASLLGGRGTALGAMLGALVIKLIENGIDILKFINFKLFVLPVSKEYSKIIIGIAIIVAVAIDRASEYFQHERSAKRKAAKADVVTMK